MGDFLENARTWVKILINTVTKAHEAEGILLVFGAGNIFRDTVNSTNFAQHIQASFIRAAMTWAPQTGNTRRNTGIRIGARRTC